jgi:hypothetical protein
VSYREHQRLADIEAAIEAIHSRLQRGDLTDGLIFDVVPIRLLEIGEAVKALLDDLLATHPRPASAAWARQRRKPPHAPRTGRSGAARSGPKPNRPRRIVGREDVDGPVPVGVSHCT